jgi:two-component system nitrate/nitrite response regulator NarL
VLVADDHEATRIGVRLALEEEGFEVVASVGDADGAVAEAVRLRPDICLLDVYMPGDGVSAARRIHDRLPGMAIVMLTVSASPEDLLAAVLAGASGYLLKSTSSASLGDAVRGVLRGEAAVPRLLERQLIDQLRERRLEGPHPRFRSLRGGEAVALTAREWEVVELWRERLPTGEIGRRLGIAESTVRRHISSVVHKLEASDRAQALRLLNTEGQEPEGRR